MCGKKYKTRRGYERHVATRHENGAGAARQKVTFDNSSGRNSAECSAKLSREDCV